MCFSPCSHDTKTKRFAAAMRESGGAAFLQFEEEPWHTNYLRTLSTTLLGSPADFVASRSLCKEHQQQPWQSTSHSKKESKWEGAPENRAGYLQLVIFVVA